MQMTPVSSSNLTAVGYEGSTLYVSFHGDTTYAYYNVPEHVYQNLLLAGSKGKYHAAFIKGHYAYDKL